MRKEITTGLLSLSLVGGGVLAGAAVADDDRGADRVTVAERSRAAAANDAIVPNDIINDGRMRRIYGANRYATAVAVAEAYGWDDSTTGSVYIANGENFPDSLVIGLANFDDGPLLLVTQGSLPTETRDALAALRPCYIDVIGGTAAVGDDVWDELMAYAGADTAKCTEP